MDLSDRRQDDIKRQKAQIIKSAQEAKKILEKKDFELLKGICQKGEEAAEAALYMTIFRKRTVSLESWAADVISHATMIRVFGELCDTPKDCIRKASQVGMDAEGESKEAE